MINSKSLSYFLFFAGALGQVAIHQRNTKHFKLDSDIYRTKHSSFLLLLLQQVCFIQSKEGGGCCWLASRDKHTQHLCVYVRCSEGGNFQWGRGKRCYPSLIVPGSSSSSSVYRPAPGSPYSRRLDSKHILLQDPTHGAHQRREPFCFFFFYYKPTN